MPELPEVETVVRELRIHLPGKDILRASLTAPDLYRRGSAAIGELAGTRIDRVDRRGKAIVITLAPGQSGPTDRLVVHLGMTGRLEWSATPPARPPAKSHLHARWQFGDGSELRYFDPRRFGFIFVGTAASVDETL